MTPGNGHRVILRVARGPAGQRTFRDFAVTVAAGATVLDALRVIRDEQDGTLAFRDACGSPTCANCGLLIDGTPRLACATLATASGREVLVIEPLANLPVIRDLVVDLGPAEAAWREVRPWPDTTPGPSLALSESASRRVDGLAALDRCTACQLCVAACPRVADTPDFLGPAALVAGRRAQRLSGEGADGARRAILAGPRGIWACSEEEHCSAVCPAGVDPAGAIRRMKAEEAGRWWRSVLAMGGRR